MVQGGETTWLDGGAIFDALPEALQARFLQEPVVYEMRWPPTRWQAEFPVSSVGALKDLLDADPRCRYTLHDDGALHLFFQTMAVRVGTDGTKRFINGLLAHLPQVPHPRYEGHVYCRPDNQVSWASGAPLTTNEVQTLVDAHDRVLNHHRWQNGDVLILDNHRLLHGRERMVQPSPRVIYSRFGFWR